MRQGCIDLTELDNKFKPPTPVDSNTPQLSDGGTMSQNFHQVKESTLQRLKESEQIFLGQVPISPPVREPLPQQAKGMTTEPADRADTGAAESEVTRKKALQLLSSGRLA
ncbi:MAG: hypothetical protein AAB412_04400, partial [Elusimicrobiota bacterium]